MPHFKGKYRIGSARLPSWDYSSSGYYFITICTLNRACFFGEVIKGEMQLSRLGEIGQRFWAEIPNHTRNATLDEYVVMPNHVHGIIIISQSGGAPTPVPVETLPVETLPVETLPVETLHATSLPRPPRDPNDPMAVISPQAGSLAAMVRSYKSAVSYWASHNGRPDFGWQARYYDHIIRDEVNLSKVRQYIRDNPLNWHLDRENPACKAGDAV
jgi:putative transposase